MRQLGITVIAFLSVILVTMLMISIMFWIYSGYFPGDQINVSVGLCIGWIGWAMAIIIMLWMWRPKV